MDHGTISLLTYQNRAHRFLLHCNRSNLSQFANHSQIHWMPIPTLHRHLNNDPSSCLDMEPILSVQKMDNLRAPRSLPQKMWMKVKGAKLWMNGQHGGGIGIIVTDSAIEPHLRAREPPASVFSRTNCVLSPIQPLTLEKWRYWRQPADVAKSERWPGDGSKSVLFCIAQPTCLPCACFL